MTPVVREDVAAVAALSALPSMGPNALGALLADRTPAAAWAAVRAGGLHRDPAVAPHLGRDPRARSARWAERSADVDLGLLDAAHRAAGVQLLLPGDDAWPERLLDDPEPPAVLCVRGELAALDRPTCGIVGTRRCSGDGRRVAFALGRDLAAAGVAVVSGLALGVDAAAHRGCLAAGDEAGAGGGAGAPVGVVAGGLDLVYPPSHVDLFRLVGRAGAVLSEVPLGTQPERWRFPARNRLIAALSDVVVVVESPVRGGSMHTVESALARDRIVGAVPGPVTSPESDGTNGLLADGAMVVRGASDVLMALGLDVARRGPAGRTGGGDDEVAAALALLGPDAVAVHGAIGSRATPLEAVVVGGGLPLGATMAALDRLAAAGLVEDAGGRWSRVGRRC